MHNTENSARSSMFSRKFGLRLPVTNLQPQLPATSLRLVMTNPQSLTTKPQLPVTNLQLPATISVRLLEVSFRGGYSR